MPIFYDSEMSLSEWLKEEPIYFTGAVDLPNLLVELGAYKSTSEARRAGREGLIPKGYTELRASKKYGTIYIWNPEKISIFERLKFYFSRIISTLNLK